MTFAVRRLAGAGIVATAFAVAAPAWAVQPDEMLADPALEARARVISQDLRCVVCQNQSIDDSNADLARDLRVLVRERLVAGDSDKQVVDYIASRYGDFVLLRPPLRPDTYLLWFGPALVLVVGAAAIVLYLRRRPAAGEAMPEMGALTLEEEARLARLMGDDSAAKRNGG